MSKSRKAVKPPRKSFSISDLPDLVDVLERAHPDFAPESLASIAKARNCAPSSVTELLNRAEACFPGHEPLVSRPQSGNAHLTPRGVAFWKRAKAVWDQYLTLKTDKPAPESERVRIGSEVMFGRWLLPRSLMRFYRSAANQRVHVLDQTIQSIHEGLDTLIRPNGIQLLLECNLPKLFAGDHAMTVQMDDQVECGFTRVVAFPKERVLSKALFFENADDGGGGAFVQGDVETIREYAGAIRHVRDQRESTVHLSQLQDIPLAFVDYTDITVAHFLAHSTAPRINLSTNASAAACLASGWPVVTINWKALFLESHSATLDLSKWDEVMDMYAFKKLITEPKPRKKGIEYPELQLNIIRREHDTSPAVARLIECLKKDICDIRDNERFFV